jgi:hypothetical protein
MKTRVQDQLRTYAEYVDEHVEPIDVAKLADETDTPVVGIGRDTLQQPSARRLGVVFIVAAAVTVAVLVPLALFRGGAATDVATTMPSATQVPATTTLPATTQVLEEIVDPPDNTPTLVAHLPPFTDAGWKWVSTGLGTGINGRFADGTWYSLDSGWNCIEGSKYYLTDGPTCADGERTDDPQEVLHLSSDGVRWTSLELDEFEGAVVNGDIHGGGPLFVTSWPIGLEPALAPLSHWTSTNGTDWVELSVEVPVELTGVPDFGFGALHIVHSSARSGATLVSLTACRTSGYVAVSTDGGVNWTITDGLPGVPVPATEATCSAERTLFHELFTIGGVFHALSYPNEVDPPTLWRSRNGTNWEVVGETTGLAPWAKRRGGGTPPPVDLGSAALGVRQNDGFGTQPAATFVMSSDGLSWREVEVPTCGAQAEAGLGVSMTTRDPGGSTWIMITPCGSADSGHVLGRYRSSSFDWYRIAGVAEAALWNTDNVLMANAGTDDSGIWLAIPPP